MSKSIMPLLRHFADTSQAGDERSHAEKGVVSEVILRPVHTAVLATYKVAVDRAVSASYELACAVFVNAHEVGPRLDVDFYLTAVWVALPPRRLTVRF